MLLFQVMMKNPVLTELFFRLKFCSQEFQISSVQLGIPKIDIQFNDPLESLRVNFAGFDENLKTFTFYLTTNVS